MRVMFILRGAQGCGKSTLPATLGLDSKVLGFDMFRNLFYSQRTTFDGDPSSTGNRDMYEKHVVKACQTAVESRMALGDLLFIDNRHLAPRDISGWQKLANKYFYDLYVVNVQGNLTDEQLLARNDDRGFKKVDKEVILNCAERYRELSDDVARDYTTISPEEIMGIIDDHMHTVDASNFDKKIFIGDVHGHYTQLQEALAPYGGIDNKKNLYVFVGDLIDRGEEEVRIAEMVRDAGDNVFFVEGNHELNMRHILSHTSNRSFGQTKKTRDKLLNAGWKARDIRDNFLSRFIPALKVTGLDQDIVVTHGGVAMDNYEESLALYPDTEFIYGTSHRGTVYHGKSTYDSTVNYHLSELNADSPYMFFHGHRNNKNIDGTYEFAESRNKVYNLEAGVTDPKGFLRIAVMHKDGTVEKVDTEVVNSNAPAKKVQLSDLNMDNNDLIRTKDCGDGITAYNFTRDTFTEGKWDESTMRARGLFMRGDTVVGRGYDKFFNIGERYGYTQDQVANNFVLPITYSLKVNGFLGIMFSDQGTLKLFSKSGPTDYSAAAWDALGLSESEKMWLARFLAKNKVSLTIEVVHPNDPHIVEQEPGGYILDVIENTLDFTPRKDLRLEVERSVLSLHVKQEWELKSRDEFIKRLEKYQHYDHNEGIVIRDAEGRMSKVKSDYYRDIKRCRTEINGLLRGKEKRYLESQNEVTRQLRELFTIDEITSMFTVKDIAGADVIDIPKLMAELELRQSS